MLIMQKNILRIFLKILMIWKLKQIIFKKY